MIKRLEPIIELHILMMLLCSDADQGQADTEHQSSDVKQIIWLEGVVNVRETTLHSMFPLHPPSSAHQNIVG